MTIPEAIPCPYIRATNAEPFPNAMICVIGGEVGLWRKVSREGRTGLKVGDGNTLAHDAENDRLLELSPWGELTTWLASRAGLEEMPANSEGEPER